MTLWDVRRRAPFAIGHRVVYVDRWLVLAETAEQAIAKAKDRQAPPNVRDEMQEFLAGTWSAEKIDSDFAGYRQFGSAPSEEEINDRDARKAARKKKGKS